MRESLKLSLAALVVVLLGALPVAAQTGRVGGLVKDDKGQPLKGATVVAENPSASPPSFTATTDDKGRFSIIGLRAGNWKLTASAPGFQPSVGQVPIRTIGAPNPPVEFTLAAGATGPTGALGRREHQGTAGRAGRGRSQDERQRLRRRHRGLPGDAHQGARAHDAAPADRPGPAHEEGLRPARWPPTRRCWRPTPTTNAPRSRSA